MRVSEFKREMDAQFEHMREQFARVDERFARVDEQFARVDDRFTALERRIETGEQTTRRHFDVVAEQLRADAKLTLEAIVAMDNRIARFMATNATEHAHLDSVASEHEARLKALENRQ